VVPLAIGLALGRERIPPRLVVAGAVLAMLPDADVLGFRFGVAYADDWGHRGATHSLVFAALLASLAALFLHEARTRFGWLFLCAAAASHGLLDMATDGGLGVALFWPFESARHFFAVTPIRVSPIGAGFFSVRGAETLLSELVWVWGALAILVAVVRSLKAQIMAAIRPDSSA
jgi:inner membrane protein